MTTREVLIAARGRIARGFIKGGAFLDANGNPCGPLSAQACCSLGAMDAECVARSVHLPEGSWLGMYRPACDAFRAAIGTDNVIDWNDDPERTQADVLAAFDRAIENCEAP